MIRSTIFHRNISWPALEDEQNKLLKRVKQTPSEFFLLVSEPVPTFTFGRSASPDDCLWPKEELERRGIGVYPVSRGGKWTYHGPGQIIVYPLVHLESLGYPKRAISRFLDDFRAGILAFLNASGIENATIPPSGKPFGIYIDGKKLASFGIAVHDGICSHGVALYLRRQTHGFAGINPCGEADAQTTSLEEIGYSLEWDKAAEQLVECIKKGFQYAKN